MWQVKTHMFLAVTDSEKAFINEHTTPALSSCLDLSALPRCHSIGGADILQASACTLPTCCFDDVIDDFHRDWLTADKPDRASLIEEFIEFLRSRLHFLLWVPGVRERDVLHTLLRILPFISICREETEAQQIRLPP